MAAIAAGVAAAAVAAAGSVAGQAISAHQATQAGKSAQSNTRVPLPPYAAATNRIAARSAILNQGQVAPSFAQYTASGGQARFPFINPGMTPAEAVQLGFYDKNGQPVNFMSPVPGQTVEQMPKLTPDQYLFLADWYKNRKKGTPADEAKVREFQQLARGANVKKAENRANQDIQHYIKARG